MTDDPYGTIRGLEVERDALRSRIADLEWDNAEHALILETQDLTLKRYREALVVIADQSTTSMTAYGTVLALRSHARIALNPISGTFCR